MILKTSTLLSLAATSRPPSYSMTTAMIRTTRGGPAAQQPDLHGHAPRDLHSCTDSGGGMGYGENRVQGFPGQSDRVCSRPHGHLRPARGRNSNLHLQRQQTRYHHSREGRDRRGVRSYAGIQFHHQLRRYLRVGSRWYPYKPNTSLVSRSHLHGHRD